MVEAQFTEQWVRRYDDPAHGADEPYAMALNPVSNTVYVTGSSYGGATNMDYATVAYDLSGNQLWVARYDGPGSRIDTATALRWMLVRATSM